MLGNPVRDDRIQSFEEYKAGRWDKVGYIVTSSYADHAASGRARGTDIGNGKCGGDVLAMYSGTVGLAGFLGAALVVRITHPGLASKFGGKEVQTGYAHLASKSVNFGQTVVKGQKIGTLGMTGATACHLHAGFTVGGIETDLWPYLDQNIAGATDVTTIVNSLPFIGPDGKPANAKVSFVAGKTVTGWALNGTSEQYVVPATGSSAPADARSAIYQSDNRAPHGGMDAAGNVSGRPFLHIPLGVFADHPYIVESTHVAAGAIVVSPPPPPTSGGGFTQADLDKANVAGYNEGRGKVQGAAAAVPPK